MNAFNFLPESTVTNSSSKCTHCSPPPLFSSFTFKACFSVALTLQTHEKWPLSAELPAPKKKRRKVRAKILLWSLQWGLRYSCHGSRILLSPMLLCDSHHTRVPSHTLVTDALVRLPSRSSLPPCHTVVTPSWHVHVAWDAQAVPCGIRCTAGGMWDERPCRCHMRGRWEAVHVPYAIWCMAHLAHRILSYFRCTVLLVLHALLHYLHLYYAIWLRYQWILWGAGRIMPSARKHYVELNSKTHHSIAIIALPS